MVPGVRLQLTVANGTSKLHHKFTPYPVRGCSHALDLVLVSIGVDGIVGHVTEVLETKLVHGKAWGANVSRGSARRCTVLDKFVKLYKLIKG